VQAVAPLPGLREDWLRRQVRRTEERIDMWLLRAAGRAVGAPAGTPTAHGGVGVAIAARIPTSSTPQRKDLKP
jgi:hypothetical protein